MAEPARVGLVGRVEHGLAGGHDLFAAAGVDVGWVEVADTGVVVVMVVPVSEAAHPGAGLVDRREAGGVVGPVFRGFEMGFAVGVVV